MLAGIEHTAIATPDPMKLARWYVDRLGFVINWQPPNSSTVFVKAPDGSMLELIESPGALAAVPGDAQNRGCVTWPHPGKRLRRDVSKAGVRRRKVSERSRKNEWQFAGLFHGLRWEYPAPVASRNAASIEAVSNIRQSSRFLTVAAARVLSQRKLPLVSIPISRPFVLTCDFDVTRTLLSATPRLDSGLLSSCNYDELILDPKPKKPYWPQMNADEHG